MFKTAARKIAHNTTLPGLSAKQDLRALQELITAEKAILNSLQRLSADFQRASEALRAWGAGEGEDLADTLGASTTLFLHFATALSTFANHELNVRDHMKAVRSREEGLDEMKRKRKSVFNDAEAAERKLSKMNPENKNLQQQTDHLNRLRDEIRTMDTDIMNEEAGLSDFKRHSARAWMGLKFGGLLECCEKGTIVGELGKLVISEISLEPTQPGLPRPYYSGHARTEFLVAEASRSISEVPYSPDPNPHPSQRTIRPLPGAELPAIPLDRPMSGTSGGSQPGYGVSSPGPGAYPGLPQVEESGFNIQQFIGNDQPPTPQNQLPPVNEFGTFGGGPIAQTHSLNPAERDKMTSPRGGRFATFPVKAAGPRPAPGATGGSSISSTNPYITPPPAMRDGDRAPSIEIDRNDESFSSSIAQALGQQFGGDGASGSTPGHGPSASTSGYAGQQGLPPSQDVKSGSDFGPQRYSPPPPMYTPSHGSGLPAGAAPPNPPSSMSNGKGLEAPGQQLQAGSRPQSTAEEEEGLAYMINDNASNESVSDSGDRRVRFGGVSDVNTELEKRHAEQEAAEVNNAAARESQNSPPRQSESEGQPGRTSPEATRSSWQPATPTKDAPPASEDRGQSPSSPSAPRIPSPPPPTGDPHDERSLNAAAAREVSRELDALMMSSPPVSPSDKPPASPWSTRPQIPSYPRQAASPRPSFDQLASQATSPKLEGMYVRQRDRSASSPVGRNAPPAPAPEAIPTPVSPTASNDDNEQFQHSIPAISRVSPAPSSNGGTPFRTPLETPLAGPPTGSLYNLPGTTGSNTSFSAPGVRTISAAAFRRPVRNASGTLVEGPGGRPQSPGLADTSPLVVKKRPLPSSPYPSPYPSANLQAPGGIPRSVSASGGEQYRQSGEEQQQRPLTHYRQDDDDFDYISAYTESAPGGGDGAPHSPGYQQGRFATNLEEGNGVL